ncbi:deoxyhypusine synthase, partial [Candidatus Woesearchaeota archaeon]|nr:deoxyhypusine synthase [Candidatus Woesearchaeota archaeon]
MTDKFRETRENVLRESEEPADFIAVQGYDFNNSIDFDKIIDSFSTTGFQATNLAEA